MSESKMFDLGDILSITDGRLVSPRKMDGVYEILNYMTGDSLFTHQLPRAADRCKPALLQQHPQLAAIDPEGTLTPDTVTGWLAVQKRLYGESLPVAPLATANWTSIDPLLEAEALFGKDRVIQVSSTPEPS